MKSPQVINAASLISLLNPDSVLAFDGESVIDNTTQLPITSSPIGVTLSFFDLTLGSAVVDVTADMTYQSASKFWTVNLSDINTPGVPLLLDRHKYVGMVSEITPQPNNMRDFKIQEFTVDNDSFEGILMRLPYQVEVSGGEAWIRWYDSVDNFNDPLHIIYEAAAYEGGVGTTFATDPSRVTLQL